MRIIRALSLAAFLPIVVIYAPATAEEPAKPQIISALDLKRGDAVVIGLLREPLGTVQAVAGSCVDPPNKEPIHNALYVTASGNIAWGAGVAIEIRGLMLEKNKRYRLEGYESGEFVGTPVKDKTDSPSLHYHPFFVVTHALDSENGEKPDAAAKGSATNTSTEKNHADDIKITFAKEQAPLPFSPPKNAENEKIVDMNDYGALAKLVAGKITALEITSAGANRFHSKQEVIAFLRQLLTDQKGSTWKFEVWSQGVQPMLVVTVEHKDGKPGQWYVGPNGDDGALSVYQDGEGKWWFSSWNDLKVPKRSPKSVSNHGMLTVESFRFIGSETTVPQVIEKLGEPDMWVAGGFYDICTYYLSDNSEVTIGSDDDKKILFVTHGKEETLFGHTMLEKK